MFEGYLGHMHYGLNLQGIIGSPGDQRLTLPNSDREHMNAGGKLVRENQK